MLIAFFQSSRRILTLTAIALLIIFATLGVKNAYGESVCGGNFGNQQQNPGRPNWTTSKFGASFSFANPDPSQTNWFRYSANVSYYLNGADVWDSSIDVNTNATTVNWGGDAPAYIGWDSMNIWGSQVATNADGSNYDYGRYSDLNTGSSSC